MLPRLRAYAAWDAKVLRRSLVLAGVGAALVAAAVMMAGKEDEDGLRVRSEILASPPADLVAIQLRRCQGLGEAGAHNPGCLAAWGENRRRFLGLDHRPAAAEPQTLSPSRPHAGRLGD